MLRNKNLTAAGKRICGITRVGVLASQIPTGFPHPPFLLNDIDPDFPGRFYRVQILTGPSPGGAVLFLGEDSSGFIAGPDGTYVGTQLVSKFDEGVGLVSSEVGTYGFTIGSFVSSDLVGSYQVSSYISSDLVAAYSVSEQLGGVSNDLVASYAIHNHVSADLDAAFQIQQDLSADLVATYGVSAYVGASLVGVYAVGLVDIDLPESRLFDLRAERRIFFLKR